MRGKAYHVASPPSSYVWNSLNLYTALHILRIDTDAAHLAKVYEISFSLVGVFARFDPKIHAVTS